MRRASVTGDGCDPLNRPFSQQPAAVHTEPHFVSVTTTRRWRMLSARDIGIPAMIVVGHRLTRKRRGQNAESGASTGNVLIDSTWAIAIMADITPAWREVYGPHPRRAHLPARARRSVMSTYFTLCHIAPSLCAPTCEPGRETGTFAIAGASADDFDELCFDERGGVRRR